MTTGGITIWFTGLPCSGKTTLAAALRSKLESRNASVFHIDGDELRKGLNKDLGFSEADRAENIRRASEISVMLMKEGRVVLASFVSQAAADRALARRIISGTGKFVEVFVDCPLNVCEERDVKGMYKKARAGEIKNFTGIQAAYETPEDAEIVIRTGNERVDESLAQLEAALIPYLKS